MKLPDFVFVKAFWEAFSVAVGGALALAAFFGWVNPAWAVPSAVILSWILALLRAFNINPQLRALRAARAARLLAEKKAKKSK